MNATESLRQATAKIEEARKEVRRVGRDAFFEQAKIIFDKYEKLNDFSWSQYTPYFNDGDECVFGVNADFDYSLKLNGKSAEDHFEAAGNPHWNTTEYDQTERTIEAEWGEIANEVSSLLYDFPTDLMKDVFGDHVEVCVNRDGTVNTEKYSHD